MADKNSSDKGASDNSLIAFPTSKARELMGARGINLGSISQHKGVGMVGKDFLKSMDPEDLVIRCLAIEKKLAETSLSMRKMTLKYIKCRSDLLEALSIIDGQEKYSIKRVEKLNDRLKLV